MNKMSISEAWGYATSFFNGQHPAHAMVLIGVGIVVPVVINLLLGGAAATTAMDPATLASGGPGAMAAFSGTVILVGLIGLVMQMASYFASWRMGLAPGQDSVGSALGYGMVAALPLLLVMFVFILVLGIVMGVIFGASVIPLIMSGGTPTDAQAAGIGVSMLIGVPVFFLFILWLTARFCCMGPVMAAQRSFNPFTGLTESWRMTGASQWKLMGYFFLIFIVMIILVMIVGMFVGISTLAGGDGGGIAIVLGALVGIPMAYLYTAVPAGIYRALSGGKTSDIFV